MDVDDVIARHRTRLEEHRRFLDGSAAASTKPPTSPAGGSPEALKTAAQPNAAEAEAASPLPVRPSGAAPGEVLSPLCVAAVSPTRRKTGCADGGRDKGPRRWGSAKAAGEEGRLQWLRELSPPPGAAAVMPGRRKSQAVSRGAAAEAHGGATLRRASSGPAVALSGNHKNIHAWIAEEERFLNAQLWAAGRYYVTRPDAMYAKSQLWLEGRERSLQRLQQEFLRDSLGECSFQPHLATSRSLQRRPSSAHAASNLCEDPSVAAHLERMEEARQLRVEAERRLEGNRAGTWKNFVTVPKEFEFAKKVTVIPSLRKPLLNVVPLHLDEKAGEGATSHTSGGCAGPAPAMVAAAPQRAPHEGGGGKKEEAVSERPAAVGGDAPNAGEIGGAAVMGGTAVSQLELVPLLEATVARLTEELASREQQLQVQRGELALLSRELEVAKATVRRLSLRDVVQMEEERCTTPGPTSPLA
ncbi:uncharacterized protein Tco025E_02248 [Trypanosoma conorhini]|uniref:Uncharacterized protein n=1 Tax=Trypanosoma conorhini TaxID=83891 RepID=A0A3R7PHW9_9TRYP|nr:uncharacterized protein Tco025E_02248 [Trypanosoma conorhini]RNF25568.1 hypothetical protein Tco025E_02248 [Trypanosoma conorhini]